MSSHTEDWAKSCGLLQWCPQTDRHHTRPLKWNAQAARLGVRYRVEILADAFDKVPTYWLADLLHLIRHTPHLDWLLLTNQIDDWRKRLIAVQGFLRVKSAVSGQESDVCDWVDAWLRSDGIHSIPTNVWIGVTICNQAEADRGIPKLLSVPAAKRFVSLVPLVGPVDLELACDIAESTACTGTWNTMAEPQRCVKALRSGSVALLDWVIVGGESGPSARPMHPDWVRGLRDQCQAAGVPFLFKLWGDFACSHSAGLDLNQCYAHNKGGGWVEPTGEFSLGASSAPRCNAATHIFKLGKSKSGRLLDGREWNEIPQ